MTPPKTQNTNEQGERLTASGGMTEPKALTAHAEIRQGARWPQDVMSQDTWEPVFESIEEGLILADREGRIKHANAAARRVFGDDILDMAAEALPRTFGICKRDTDIVIMPEETPLCRALRGEPVAGEELLAREVPGVDGKGVRLDVTAHPVTREDGGVDGAWMLVRDLRLSKEIREQMALREHALNISAEGFTISDATSPDNPLIYVNEGFERLTGYSREEVIGENCRFLQGPATNKKARAEIKQAIMEERDCVVELLNYRKDGSEFWNRLSITPVRDETGRVCNFIGVQSDITKHVKTEERLKQASRELQKANTRLVENVNAAARVQRSLLPQKDVQVPGAKFAWRYQPCEGLAGDLLNIFRLDEDHVGFYVLDVSGHGTAAALLSVAVNRLLLPTVSASSLVKRQRRKDRAYEIVRPAKVAEELNKTFPWEAEAGQFFTIVYAVLNCRTRELRFVSAGHPGFVHVPVKSSCEIATSADLPIGLQREPYQEHIIRLEPGDRVYMYSDGVSESANPTNGLFGEERLCRALEEQRRLSLDNSLEDLLKQLEAWRRGAPPRDDISLLACQIPR